jgi:thiol peroxidase
MANITLGGNPATTLRDLPALGTKISDFKLTAVDMSTKTLSDFVGSKLVLNIFPSVNTGICSASVRKFNEAASKMENTKVLCISKDLPFSQQQFCAAEGIEDVVMLSDFKTGAFGRDYGVTIQGSNFDGLLSRAVIVVDENNVVLYTEQVPEIAQEPNYEAALSAL